MSDNDAIYRPLGSHTLEELLLEAEDQDATATALAKAKAELADELKTRFAEEADGFLSGRPGTWRSRDVDAVAVVKGVSARTVDWDSKKLLKIATSMPLADAEKIFDHKIKVKETTYANLTGEVRAAVELARSVKVGDVKFTIERPG